MGNINFPKSSPISPVRPSIRIAAVQVSMKRRLLEFSVYFMNDDIYRMIVK